jgi:protein-S-isoprenylcysteine O-methyltransferase Ste14
MFISYLILILLWLIYFTVHSLLAAQKVKKYFEKSMGSTFRYYRLIYNFIALMGLLGILFYNAIISSHVLLPASWLPIVKFIGLVFATWGVLVLRLAFKAYSLKEFLGLTQARNESLTDEKLQTGGILQYVRHPIYSGTLLLIVGFWLFSPTLANLISTVCIIGYTLIGMRLEEAKLIVAFGDTYRQYKNSVPALMPSWRALKGLF